jgi:hypothetical protein
MAKGRCAPMSFTNKRFHAHGHFAVGVIEWNRELVIVQRQALVAQLDRASDFESEGREFESLRARQ